MTTRKFSQLMRLIWIDMKLECGPLNRNDIAKAFGTSVQQASYDIKAFQGDHPNTIKYDHRARHYIRPPRASAAYPQHLRLQVQGTVRGVRIFRGEVAR
jgi:hypothetical protein